LTHGERLEERQLASLILSSCYRKPCQPVPPVDHGERLGERKLASLILYSCYRKPCQPVPPVDPCGEAGGETAGLFNPLLLFQETLSACSTC
jgi:hypothetical protein